ncbi:P4 family phage/plasmid primase [Candidatus Liberibacter solanacearum CLso-ZC1]|uniref:p4 family phage/plasmid primase n=2 Tax=Liberibacter solanacearum (strain CLso-ZC1) TaxID=658172 RepID=E4UC66_LIBSC|nr:phage/plasmid primase, P4 family [Candidatus Liberibacter solanacearum]ADR51956.1 P4 family phage/plasmid primase [Candidatus Liberibacter solanacearum CLso-ZC1]
MAKAGIKKKQTPKSQQGHLDILGGGQYFVAYNIHPKTKEEYTWTTPPDAFKAEELPLLSEEDVEHLFEFFKESTTPVVKAKKEIKSPKEGNTKGNRRYTNREITAFLSCFGEEFTNGTHDEWIPVVMAIHHETQGSHEGKELARRWSKRGSSYDEENFNYKWSTFDCEEEGDSEKKRSTFASIFYHHRKLIPDGILEERFSDAYNKAMFSVFKSGYFLYASDTKAWYKKDKTNRYIWRITDDKIAGYIMEFLISMKKDAFDLCEEIENKDGTKKNPRALYLKAYAKRNACEQSRSKSTANAIEAKSPFHISSEIFDANLRYIGERDGILDMETGQQITPKEELYITKSTGTPFVEGKPSAEFMNLVSNYFESKEVMNFFTRCVGMALLGGNEAQRFIHIRGVGGSGKSTLMNLIKFAFGNQYVINAEASDVMQNRPPEAGKANPSLIRLMGSRVVIISETNENDELNAAKIKQMTGGDCMTARLNYGNTYSEARASFTPFIVSNKHLFVRNPDDAWWRRYIVIPFDKPIANRDATFAQKLETEYALEAKKWFMEGIKAYIRNGRNLDVYVPEVCINAKEEERRGTDTYQAWIDDCCDVGSDLWEESRILAKSYSEYREQELNYDRKRISTRTVTLNLKQKGFIGGREWDKSSSDRGKYLSLIKGLKLKPAFEDIENEPNNVLDFKK